MNLLLLEADDLCPDGTARVAGRRAAHLREVIGVDVGTTVVAGMLDGAVGAATVLALEANAVLLALQLDSPPPPRLDVRLILALPRPKSLRRIAQGCAAMGLRALHLVNTWRVEKSYWSSPLLDPGNMRRELMLGAEQGRDTILPEVHLHKRFRPFVEDELPAVSAVTVRLVGDIAAARACPAAVADPVTLVIGPEGGLIPFEIDLLVGIGFNPVTVGRRALRVEQAVPALLGRLSPVVTGRE